ncbi:hypothetical protein DPMN_171204 [Dreissena polymorpha]|uniref:Transposase n=1 Tax=Dreissena polymorpha TaxID=45954 RepID=A0A9D4IFC5_DREPO|nr:hypothetical protein DPMN_171204 [Dreissena polymorpha]
MTVTFYFSRLERGRAVFPGREMKGCAFHWSQAVWRRVQHEGLAEVYRRCGGVFKFIRMLMALQFLPAITGINTLRKKPPSLKTVERKKPPFIVCIRGRNHLASFA